MADTLNDLKAQIDQGKQKEVIATISNILKKSDKVPDVHRLLAFAYLKDGSYKKAVTELQTARKMGTSAENELAFGRMLRGEKFFEAAQTCFKAAEKIEPHNVDALALISMTHQSLGETKQMLEQGQRCLEMTDRLASQQAVPPLPLPDNLPAFDPKARKRNVISYSLFGNNTFYLESAIACASMAVAIFPEWTCRFYCGPDIPKSTIKTLQRLRAQIVLMPKPSNNWSGLFWRFTAFDDPNVDFVMVRDVDSPFTIRERMVVDEWLDSPSPFHAIRDDPNHMEPLMAGMWGGRTGILPPVAPLVQTYLPFIKIRYADQHFLRLNIWPRICDITLSHDRHYSLRNSRKPPEHPTQDKVNIGFGLPR